MLLGRGRECTAIEQALTAVHEPSAAVLVLRGPAGVGKTALLDWAVASAPSFDVLRVDASERAQPTRWATLRDIIRMVPIDFASLVPNQQDVLTAVLDGTASDPLAAGASMVSLLSAAANPRPILVVVDDAQWADEASRFALRSGARRIQHEPIVMLMAEEGESDGKDSLPALAVGGLSPIDAVTLLAGRVETKVAEELARVTDGNPLAMLEITEALSPEQRAGTAPLGEVVPLSEVLLHTFERRTAHLSDDERYLLVLAAAEPDLDVRRVHAAAALEGMDATRVDVFLGSGFLRVRPDGRLEFARRLLREAVYESAPVDVRRRAHRLLARVSVGDIESERRAWHLAAAAEGFDPEAGDALEAVATRALARGDARTAGDVLTRAADLSPEAPERVKRLVAAGDAYVRGEHNEPAVSAYELALHQTADPYEQAEIQISLAGPRLAVSVSASDAFRDLARLADSLRAQDPARAALLDTHAALTAVSLGDAHAGRTLTRRALGVYPSFDTREAQLALSLDGLLAALSGEYARAAPALLAVDAPSAEVFRSPSSVVFEYLVAEGLTWLGEFSAASRLVAALVDRSRDANAVVLLARSLVVRAGLYLRTGYWDAALADANEAADFALELHLPAAHAFALTVMARLEAGLGRGDDARRHGLEALERADASNLAMNVYGAHGALGFVALSDRRGSEAVERLEAARSYAEREGITSLMAVPWAPDLVEMYLRTDQREAARGLVEQLGAWGVQTQGPLAEAVFARCRALTTDEGVEDQFRVAMAAHGHVLAAFERARTLLAYGEWLRRERRTAESAPKLEEAAAMFDRLGAVGWRDRATAELDARGRRSPGASREGRSRLTPQEFRVACTVAAGATNREAAAALFLSPRTVEHHLTTVYRKLGIRSRSELTRRVTTDPEFAAGLRAPD
ncbi:MAG TPA: AAA family ATPase, partial [Acidimicrobiia bacterium]